MVTTRHGNSRHRKRARAVSLKHFWLLIPVALYVWWLHGVGYPPGVLVPAEPVQGPVADSTPWEKAGYRITPLATYRIRARVLATTSYWFDRGSDLAPMDVAVGWGAMSDQSVLDQLWFSQSNRFLEWHTRKRAWPVPFDELNSHSANMHIVPANRSAVIAVKSLRPGNIVHMTGYLIQADASDGGHWKSSLSRTDSGPGACELMWVERVERE
jgi:hypothetical protein